MGKEKSKHRKALDAALAADDIMEYDRLEAQKRASEAPSRNKGSNQDLAFDRYQESQRAKARSEYDKKLRLLEEHMGKRDFEDRGQQLLDPHPVKSYMQSYEEMPSSARLAARDRILMREKRAALPEGQWMGGGYRGPQAVDSVAHIGSEALSPEEEAQFQELLRRRGKGRGIR
jgi:hypothetical protein